MSDGLRAAIRRFPERRSAIEAMTAHNEELRSLCEDLAAAEAATALWDRSASPLRDKRVAEYTALANGLAAELKMALEATPIVPFTRRRLLHGGNH
jgi:hypothetical protein